MSLSASIPALKSKARKLRRAERIRLSEALDRVAAAEGYSAWSLLVAREAARRSHDLLDRLNAGDLVLLGARPRHGKTICAVQLLVSSLRRYRQGWFFSLGNDDPGIEAIFESLGERRSAFGGQFALEHSDEICAPYIIEKIGNRVAAKAVAVIDHLQLLDQRRRFAPLQEQVSELNTFAKRTGCIIVCISQIRSSFDAKTERLPSLDDVRLLDALDLSLFDKFVFLHEGRLLVQSSGAR